MITLINYNSGDLEIREQSGQTVRLPQTQANRLILAARMRQVEPFIEKLASLIPHPPIAQSITHLFQQAQGSERWNLKEKFARLQTISTGYAVENPDIIAETIEITKTL